MNANTTQTTALTGQTPTSGKRRSRRDVDIWSLLLEGRAFVAKVLSRAGQAKLLAAGFLPRVMPG